MCAAVTANTHTHTLADTHSHMHTGSAEPT